MEGEGESLEERERARVVPAEEAVWCLMRCEKDMEEREREREFMIDGRMRGESKGH